MITGVKILDNAVIQDAGGRMIMWTGNALDEHPKLKEYADENKLVHHEFVIRTVEHMTGKEELVTIWSPDGKRLHTYRVMGTESW